jgi:hypothetical protein
MSVCNPVLVIWNSNRIFSAPCYIVVCGLCGRTILSVASVAVPYCRLWHVWPFHIFPHYLTKDTNFGKKLRKKNVFRFYLQILSKTFLILE